MQSFGSRFDSARGECGHILPELFPWETSLPWASTTLKENVAVWPEGASPARASACVKAAAASTSRGAGTSTTARSRNAGGRSVAGRRRGGRPNIAWPPRSKLGTPRQRARRERAKSASQAVQHAEVAPTRGHAAEAFFPFPYVIGRAATNRP